MTKPTRKPRSSAQKTRRDFLDAAEEVYCEHGYKGSTIRAITDRADANLGALQYYWGGKRELFHDLLQQRFQPVHALHLLELKEIENTTSASERPNIEKILRSLLKLTLADPEEIDGTEKRPSRKLYSMAMMDPSPIILKEMNNIFNDSISLFIKLMRQALPDLSNSELDWRINCVIGAHILTLTQQERMFRFFGNETKVDNKDSTQWVLNFLMNGINAPSQSKPNIKTNN